MIDFTELHFGIGFLLLAALLIGLRSQKRRYSYLFFFSIFWVYLLFAVKEAIFPIHIPTESPVPGFWLPEINVLPLNCSQTQMPGLCYRTVLENILLTIPFGFGIRFLGRWKPRQLLGLAVMGGAGFETVQWIIALITKSSFRVIDINDVFLNTAGVLIGYAGFWIFARIYPALIRWLKITPRGILAYLMEMVL